MAFLNFFDFPPLFLYDVGEKTLYTSGRRKKILFFLHLPLDNALILCYHITILKCFAT